MPFVASRYGAAKRGLRRRRSVASWDPPQAALAMGKYSREAENSTKSCKASGSDLRVHFKNTRESAMAIKKMGLYQAKQYLEDVLEHKRVIVFRRFCGGVGRTAFLWPVSK